MRRVSEVLDSVEALLPLLSLSHSCPPVSEVLDSVIDVQEQPHTLFLRFQPPHSFRRNGWCEIDTYASIRVDRSVRIEEGGEERSVKNLEEFSRIVRRGLKDGGRVVIDEFQRLPEKILEDLAAVHPEGRLILSGSSMRVVTKLIGKGSSFLGILYPYHLSQIKARDNS